MLVEAVIVLKGYRQKRGRQQAEREYSPSRIFPLNCLFHDPPDHPDVQPQNHNRDSRTDSGNREELHKEPGYEFRQPARLEQDPTDVAPVAEKHLLLSSERQHPPLRRDETCAEKYPADRHGDGQDNRCRSCF